MIKPVGATTVTGYMAQLDDSRKKQIKTLHNMIRKAVPALKPGIVAGMIGYGNYHYKYASGREGDWPIIALASQKNYISLYVCASENGKYLAEMHKKDLPKASIGKSCIRFKKLEDVDLGLLQKIVEAGARVMADKYSAA